MITREIPKNIEEFKPKIAGPFTMRNLACLLLAAIVVAPTAYILNIYFVPKLTVLVCAALATPFLACGWWEPFDLGLPFEKFIVNYLKQKFILPFFRKYETNSTQGDYLDVNGNVIYEDYNGFEIEREFYAKLKEKNKTVAEDEDETGKKKGKKKTTTASTVKAKQLEADRKEIGFYL